jgi:hypothetical protein
MARSRITFDTVREIASALPGVEETTSWGAPSLKVHGSMMACIPTNKAAEPDSLLVAVDFERRAELLAEAPDVYYCPDHYQGYPGVLVRFSKIRRDALEGLLRGAWTFAAKKPARKKIGAPAAPKQRLT